MWTPEEDIVPPATKPPIRPVAVRRAIEESLTPLSASDRPHHFSDKATKEASLPNEKTPKQFSKDSK